ncbi:MAG: integrase domain-containing protein [Caldisericota bacterium]|nr:integrase domain-containing protein [Caldisericota bacterium]
MLAPVMSFKSATRAEYLGKTVSRSINRGSALSSKVTTVLNEIRENLSVKSLKNFEQPTVEAYADYLKDRVEEGNISLRTATDRISTLNTITTKYLEKQKLFISAKEWHLSRGSQDYSDMSISSEVHQQFSEYLQQQGTIQAEALKYSIGLQRKLGLRARESFSIKQTTIRKALKNNILHINRDDGTKNSKPRDITIKIESQREILKNALNFMKEHKWKSLIKPTTTRLSHSGWAYRQVTKFREAINSNYNFHAERHSFAHEQYANTWKEQAGIAVDCPVVYGGNNWISYAEEKTSLGEEEIEKIDKDIREEISHELGHNRLEITNTYLGK